MRTICISLAIAAATALATPAKAAEPVTATIGTDIVSTYAWRGQKLDGMSIQPSLGVEWSGLSLSAWGSTGITGDYRELDFTFAYSIGGLTVGITDYWCADSHTPYFDFASGNPHVAEVNVGYDFGPLAVNCYANVLGAVGCRTDGSKAYSSYIEISAPFSLGGLDWSVAAGATPWENDYYKASGFALVCASLTVSSELSIGNLSIPGFAQLMANPSTRSLFFTVGASF